MYDTVKDALGLTEITKAPFRSLTVPLLVPFSMIEAPMIGSPSLADTTIPFTCLFCPQAIVVRKNINRNNRFRFIMIIMLQEFPTPSEAAVELAYS